MSGLTIAEMHRGIRLGLQQADSNFHDGYQPEEIDFYINSALQRYVKTQYSALKESQDPRQEYSLENLRTLIIHRQFTEFEDSDRIPQAKMVYLPGHEDTSASPGEETFDYEYFVHAHVHYGLEGSPSPEGDEVFKVCDLIDYMSLRQYLPTQINPVPWFENVPILIYENQVHILRERAEDVIEVFDLIYLRAPAKVSRTEGVDCDLPDHTHLDIVSMTVNLMMADVSQGRSNAQAQPQ